MVTKPFLAARIPEDLNTKLEEHSASTGEGKTQAVINALARYLNFTPESKSEESAGDRLSLLEKKVAELENLVKEPKQFSPLEDNPSRISANLEITSDNSEQDKVFENSQGVISLDNNSDNKIDNITDNRLDNTANNVQTSIIDEVVQHPDSQYGEYLGQMKTKDVISLPGLGMEDVTKLRNKLNSVKKTTTKMIKVGLYTLFLTLLNRGEGKKQEFLWDVYKNENSLITTDNI